MVSNRQSMSHKILINKKEVKTEKFQLSIQNLNNLWSFIEVYAVFVPNVCGEKSVRRKFVWRNNDKYEVGLNYRQDMFTWPLN